MKMYLSSFRIGNKGQVLSELISGQKRIGVIRNALDYSNDTSRLLEGKKREFHDLEILGLYPEEIDLKLFFSSANSLIDEIKQFDALWVVGGNSFILRRAMRQSGLDKILQTLQSDTSFVYAGYSAGACVTSPTLQGLHLDDDPTLVPDGYSNEIIWEGLNLIPFSIAPHFRSNHPESPIIDKVVDYFIENKMLFIALHDDEVHLTSI